MLLSLSTTHAPATDLGYLLAKHPARVQPFELPFGTARVFYPEADASRCTAVLMLDVDPIGLVRGRGDGSEGPLAQYVNDRPYVANSFLAVALARVFGSAMSGTSKGRQELADSALPLEAEIPVLCARGGEEAVRACFEPLGYAVDVTALPLDPHFPDWGDSPYVRLRLQGTIRLSDLLTHLYVLLPAIDGDKHYFVGEDEVAKLLDKAGHWLGDHPQREWIVSRYLKRRRSLVRSALSRLLEQDEDDIDTAEQVREATEDRIERPLSLNDQRMGAVLSVLRQSGARRVVDLGCGEGYYLRALIEDPTVTEVVGVDVSPRALEYAERRLNLDRRPDRQRAKLTLRQSSVTYRDDAIAGFDAVLLIEVIEHLEPDRIASLEAGVFGAARPRHVILTTPNREYNGVYELADGHWRHPDHRFEWTRAELEGWATRVADEHGYRVEFRTVGDVDPELGAPTQLALFTDEIGRAHV